jgi:excinuclease ABC subunit C
MIPKTVKVKNSSFPNSPGVYKMKDAAGAVIYVGKAGSLKRRVSSYFLKAHDNRIGRLVLEIREIDYIKTPTVIEALILESELIKKYQPKFNIKDKDDKSFLYVVFTKEDYSRVLLVRGTELKCVKTKKVFGPFVSASSIRAALAILRRIFPWNSHLPTEIRQAKRPCFNYQIGLCPGICIGVISKKDYSRTIKNLILFFSGKKKLIIKNLRSELRKLSKAQEFERAVKVRDMIFALEHIQDTALITKDDNYMSFPRWSSRESRQLISGFPIESGMTNIFGRIEGYDISNIFGTSAVGSMVVFADGEPEKSEYRKFKIKTVRGINDIAMLKEVLRRRFINNWPRPDIILIDGGLGQVNAAKEILCELKLSIPIVGIAKGITRKKDELVYDKENLELMRLSEQYKDILVHVRDEAHRFAIEYHRKLREKMA